MYHWNSRPWLASALAVGLLAAACGGKDEPKNTIIVSITSPATESYLRGEVTITVEVQGEAERVALFVDGAALQTLEAPPYTFTWQSDQAEEAVHTIEAIAYGPGGSQGRSGQILVQVDRTGPELDLTGLTLPLLYTGAENSVAFAAADDAGIYELRLLAGGTPVGACDLDSCSIDWDVSALPDGEVILTFEAEDLAGNVASEDVPVLVVNQGTPVTFYEGAGTANWVIPEAWQVMETDLKFHFDMPADTDEVLAVLQWSRREWPFELAIGTGECPDAGVRLADLEADGGQVALHHTAAELGETAYPVGMWFIHLSGGIGLDMGAHVGEGTRIAFVMVLY